MKRDTSVSALMPEDAGSGHVDEKDYLVGDAYRGGSQNAFQEKVWSNKKRRYAFLCCLVTIVGVVIIVPIALLVIAPKIAQSAIDGSKIQFTAATISDPRNDAFTLRTVGSIADTGPFSARITFPSGITVSYKGLQIANLPMEPVDASAGSGAKIDSTIKGTVLNATAFGAFSKEMVMLPSFDWRLQGPVTVSALGRTFENLVMDKTITFPGFGGLKNVSIVSFDLPGNDPSGGIAIVIQTLLVDPSTIGIEMGNLTFDVALGGNVIGTSLSPNTTISPGPNLLKMTGRLAPGASQSQISQMFTDFIGGRDTRLSVIGSDIRPADPSKPPVTWLQQAFIGLALEVTLPANKSNIITGVETQTFVMSFDPANPWAPKMTSPGVITHLNMPFAFPLEISSVNMVISLLEDGATMANISSGWVPATSKFTGIQGTMAVDLMNGSIVIPTSQQAAFADFLKTTLYATGNVPTPVSIVADSVATTAVGNVTISGITYKTDLNLVGIQGLAASPVEILAFDIIGGTTEYMTMALTTKIVNPSNVEIAQNSDVTFDMVYNGQVVGTVTLPNLTLKIGENVVNATARFSPKTVEAKAAGSELIAAYIGGKDATVSIQGSPNSTVIAPLVPALSSIKLSSTLPGLKSKLMVNSRFMLTPTTATDLIAVAGFDAMNPTSAPLSITHVTGQLLRAGNVLGTMDLDVNFTIPAHSTARSPTLNTKILLNQNSADAIVDALNGNLTVDIQVSTLRIKVGEYVSDTTYTQTGVATSLEDPAGGTVAGKNNLIVGLETGNFYMSFDPANPWRPTMSSPNIVTKLKLPFIFPMDVNQVRMAIDMNGGLAQIVTDWVPSTSSFSGYDGSVTTDLTNGILQIPTEKQGAFAEFLKSTLFGSGVVPLPVNVIADTRATTPAGTVAITGVPYATSLQLRGLQGLASSPVQILAFDIVGGTPEYMSMKLTTKIVNPSNIQLAQNSDAVFQMLYLGQVVGTVTLPNLTLLIGDNVVSATAKLQPQTPEAVAAASQLVGAYIGGKDATVQIAGFSGSTVIPPLAPALSSLSLSSVLPATKEKLLLNSRFQLTPTSYLDLVAKAGFDAYNPTTVDLALTHVTAELIYQGSVIATIDSDMSIAIPAKGSVRSPTLDTKINLIPAAAQAIVDALSGTLNVTIKASVLRIKVGDYSIDSTYSQDNVAVSFEDPAGGTPASKNGIITSVETTSFVLAFDPSNPWSPKMSSPNVVSHVHMPFVFPLEIQQVQMTINMLAAAGSNTTLATIASGWQPATSNINGADGTMTTNLKDGVLTVPAATQSAFAALLKAILYATGPVPLPVAINANAQAHTVAGDVTITDIPFSTELTLQGMQGLAAQPVQILEFKIVGGTAAGMQIALTNRIFNPSNVEIQHNSDVMFHMTFQNEVVGTVTLPNLNLKVGENIVAATAIFNPQTDSAKAAGKILNSAYVGGGNSTVGIAGFAGSTVLGPLVPAFNGLTLTTSLAGITDKLLINSRFAIDLVNIKGQSGFSAYNPTDATMTITHLTADIIWQGYTLTKMDADTNIVLPPKSKVKSPLIPVGIDLTETAVAAVLQMLLGTLDVTVTSPSMRISIGGYPIEVSYTQDNVHVTYIEINPDSGIEYLVDPDTGLETVPYPDI
ncbi:hypothetical protein M427DRAFT_27841 [Gonapodya prolifera JEL478]|uniref:Tag1-like fifth Ig-like domain-containing protein n=1 Tax=Gonapodya prolifera (strain JEL478) TaxID=1344416 RepID=A0A139AVG3_GONPJ|nr:hypothetical protein M427DRAFT_27841 [Gonapodya prolifera JEL478]|eukprot:KXS20722.1 hypothetical protein M427DRAFT_27841 [Gonapodya prolifera JEL478]